MSFDRGTIGGSYRLRELASVTRERATDVEAAVADPLPDVVLVGCVKTKAAVAKPARDLYASPLWRARRRVAEASGVPWFVLSAEHGLLDPATVIAPYERHLQEQPSAYRRAWGETVVSTLAGIVGQLDRVVVEIHASDAYVAAVEAALHRAGSVLVTPVRGLSLGEQLRFYAPRDVEAAVAVLGEPSTACRAAAFPPEGLELRVPGLYSWWVDEEGAADLEAGSGHGVDSGLLYVGQAGATTARAGITRESTLLGRVGSQHLRGRISASTFRLTLAAVLAGPLDLRVDDGELLAASTSTLSAWMGRHLAVACLPVSDRSSIGALEVDVIRRLDPPFNLQHMVATPLRLALRQRRAEVRSRRRA